MKVLIVYSDLKCSCTRKGTFELSKGIRLFTPTDILHHLELKEHHFEKYDIILFQRLGGNAVNISNSFFKSIEELSKKYKNKTKTLYFLDDLLINETTTRFMSLVDWVLVPNPNYLKYTIKYNDNVFFTRTFLDLEEVSSLGRANIKKDRLNLLWASTGGLGTSFMGKLIPEIIRDIPEAIIYIMGSSSGLFRKYENVVSLPILPYEDFIKYFKSCDIYLNPISIDSAFFRNVKNIDFINCKSEVKYIIAGSLNIPIISSRSQPYEYAIKNGINGILLENNVTSWIEYIKKLKTDNKLRNKITKNAYEDVSSNYSLRAVGERLYTFFKSIRVTRTFISNPDLSSLSYASYNQLPDINQNIDNSVVGEIFGNKKIFQSFMCKEDNLFKIELRFATYMRTNKGTIRVSIQENFNSPPIRSKDIKCEDLYDNQWSPISFAPIPNSKDKKYYIKIEGINCRVGSSVTLYYSSIISIPGELYINRTKFNGSLALITYNLG